MELCRGGTMPHYTLLEKIIRKIMFVVIALIALSMVYPFYYAIIYALSDSKEAISQPVLLWPVKPTLAVFKRLAKLKLLWTSYLNSIIVTSIGTFLAVFMTTLMAYPLSVRRLRGRRIVSFMIFFTMLFGGGMIPNYLLMENLGLLNTRIVLILPGILNAYNILIMRSFFLGIPGELEESANIDGATPMRILLQIILPVSLPALAVQAMFYGVGFWNSYFDCVLYIDNASLMTLQAYLRTLISGSISGASNVVDSVTDNAVLSNETIRMGTVAASVIPVLIVYPMLQKYYVKGLVVGSVKG